MSRTRSIVERLVSGEECDVTRIDDEIDAWHESDTTIALHEWLGLTPDEYQLYVEKPNSLGLIIAARRRRQSLNDFVAAHDDASLDSCGADATAVSDVRHWLKVTGRLEA